MELQVVHISGITTVVLQFDKALNYTVKNKGQTVDVDKNDIASAAKE